MYDRNDAHTSVGSEPQFIHPFLVVPPHEEKRHHERNRDQHQHADLLGFNDCAHPISVPLLDRGREG